MFGPEYEAYRESRRRIVRVLAFISVVLIMFGVFGLAFMIPVLPYAVIPGGILIFIAVAVEGH